MPKAFAPSPSTLAGLGKRLGGGLGDLQKCKNIKAKLTPYFKSKNSTVD